MRRILLITVILLSGNFFAQDSTYFLRPVEITGIRKGISNFQSYSIINKEEIQKGEAGLSLDEPLERIPGVIVNNRHNPSLGDRISIRGIGSRASFGIRGIKILADNIPLTLPDGQSQTNNIDLFSTGQIEVLRGPVSSLYGNASGGVINLQTEIPEVAGIKINPQIILGEHGLKKYLLKLSGSLNSHSYLISFNNTNYKGFREHSAQKIYHINSVYRNKISDNFNLTAVINFFNSPYLQNPGSLDKNAVELNRTSARDFVITQGAGQKSDQVQGGVTVNYNSGSFNLQSTFYLLGRSLLNPIPGRIIDLRRKTEGIRTILNKNFNEENYILTLSGGIDIEYQDDLRKEFENKGLPHKDFSPEDIFKNLLYGGNLLNQEENVLGIGPLLFAEFNYKSYLGFTAGARYDNYIFKVNDLNNVSSGKIIMDQVSPAAGIFYKPHPLSKIFLNFSSSFQTPTTSELGNRPDTEGGFNNSLSPERIHQLELGGNYILNDYNLLITAALYLINFNGMLIPYQVTGSEEIFYRNAGKAANKGAEVSLEFLPSANFEFQFSYSVMNFIFKDYTVEYNESYYQLEGNEVPGVPGQLFSFNINYLTESGFWGKLKINWAGELFANDFNGAPPGSNLSINNFINESYLNINIRAGYVVVFSSLNSNLFLGVNNLLDKKYNSSILPNAIAQRFFEPAPLRSFYFGLEINY